MPVRSMRQRLIQIFFALTFFALNTCGGGDDNSINIDAGVFGPNVWGTPDTFRGAGIIDQEPFLFGGPLTRGRTGDILLQNDNVRIIIQKPYRSAGVGMFGGNIVDADRFRPSSEPGQDQFGVLYPLINLAWTVNYQRLEIINADFANGPVVVRATGVLDVYDYIQTNIIVPFAKIFSGVELQYSDQFDDVFNPFTNIPLLRSLNPIIVTDYTLAPDASYVIMETKFQNDGEKPLNIAVGDWVNGSGTIELFIPKKGFVRGAQVDESPALVYQALEEDVGVSYGYFYNPIQFVADDGTLPAAASLSVSGVTPMVLGESSLLNIIPLSGEPKIRFQVDPGVRTITRYFVVGTGDIASVLDEGYKALGLSKLRLTGKVIDNGGGPIERARVVVMDEGNPVTSGFSDAAGNFAMDISSGTDVKDQLFGSGAYTIEVYKEGYHLAGSKKSGKCSGGSVDTAAKTVSGVTCQLGATGQLSVTVDSDGGPGPVRVVIVGFDPSPIHPYIVTDALKFGKYYDVAINERPYGIVDLLYVDPSGEVFPKGNPRLIGSNSIRLEPGEYEIYFIRGMEYSIDHQRVTIPAGGTASAHGTIAKVVDTTGYVSGDFHVHGINSPDSPYRMESRIRAAMAEGLDILVGTDHEYLTDYLSMAKQLGYDNHMTAFIGDEMTPLAYGHMVMWPLQADAAKPDHGAYDYTYVPEDDILNPDKDMVQSLTQVIQGVDQASPGTQVFSIAHITDKALGNYSIAGLVSSPAFGIQPLSTFADPVRYRLPANTHAAGNFQPPFPLGTSEMITMDNSSVGLTISTFSDIFEHLHETSLPTYFNLLNNGQVTSATGESDTHCQVREPVGVPRNFVISSVDPRDGIGTFGQIDEEEIAVNVNAGRVVVTNGVFIDAKLKSAANPTGVTVGGTITGTGDVTLEMNIRSNEYFDWDTVEVFANTQPAPAKDDMSGPTDLGAKDFLSPTKAHIAKYRMNPLVTYHKGDAGETALTQTVSGGVRHATLTKDFHFTEDTWVVVVVYGSSNVRSTFPYLTKRAKPPAADGSTGEPVPGQPTSPDKFLDTLDTQPVKIGGSQAWAFTNPLFVDVDGDGWKGIYQASGVSPLTP